MLKLVFLLVSWEAGITVGIYRPVKGHVARKSFDPTVNLFAVERQPLHGCALGSMLREGCVR